MRKIYMMALCLSLAGLLTACGNGNSSSFRDSDRTTGVKELLAEKGNAASESESAGSTQTESPAATPAESTEPGSSAPAPAQENPSAENSNSVSSSPASVETSGGSAVQAESTEPGSSAPASQNSGQTGAYDVDLTQLSSTMVYSEVYNMMVEPEKYIGKTVKMTGIYSHYYTETTNKDYFSCIVQDATACCAQGIEFVLTDDYKYPEDYPVEGDLITVAGTYQTYYEGEYMYCTLENAVLLQ